MQQSVLLLGGSRQQVPVIEMAKSLGYRTILVDYLPDNPGRLVADKWYPDSTTDIEATCRIAAAENVCAILAYASDPAALPAAIACERLQLPTNPASSVEILSQKHLFRKFLADNNFPTPQAISFSADDLPTAIAHRLSSLSFPIVVKPTDSSGSRGISIIRSVNQLASAIASALPFSRNKTIIAEEYVSTADNAVIGGDIFIENGKITFLGLLECLRDPRISLIPIGKKTPENLTDLQLSNIRNELQRLVDLLHLRNGEMNIELILDTADRPLFLEIGPRAGGNMIPLLLSDSYNIDLIHSNVKAALGIPVDLNIRTNGGIYLSLVLYSRDAGIFSGVEYNPLLKPYLYREVLYKQPGEHIDIFDNAAKAVGIAFFHFPTPEACHSAYNPGSRPFTIHLAP